MQRTVKNLLQSPHRGESGPFVQMCIVALVFALFSSFFFAMAIMDLRRLEDMFLNLRMKRANDIVLGMEQTVEKKIRNLTRMNTGNLPLFPNQADASSVQDAFVRPLIGAAQSVDIQDHQGGCRREQLQEFADSEVFSSISILAEDGTPRVQTAPLPRFLMPKIEPLLDGREQAVVLLFEDASLVAPLGFVGIHRQMEKGAVILLLDAGGLERWRLIVSVRKTAEEIQWIRGVTYLILDDASGRTLVRAGDIPELSLPAPSNLESWGRTGGNRAPNVRTINANTLEISLPFQLYGKTIGTARVGLGSPADQLVLEERRHIIWWTGAMIFTGLIAMGIFYWTQNRHFLRMQAIRERLKQAERLSALGRLAAGVAHEIRNPLNAISMATQRIQKEFSPREDDARKEFEHITYIVRDEIKRLDAIVEDFLSLSRTDRLELRQQAISDVVGRILFLVRDEAEARGVGIEEHGADCPARIFMDARKMEQAILNIVRNALESIQGKGTISIAIQSENDAARIIVQDSGAGMQPEELDRIFDPFYTTKGSGTGIGLCIANEIVTAHGGEILVRSEPGKGTTFEILLPRKSV